MTAIQNLISELRETRLWPVVAALILALVAVPVLLSSSSAPVAVAPLPEIVGASASVPALTAVSVVATPNTGRLRGRGHDPFAQQTKGTAAGGKGTSGTTSTPKTATAAKASSPSTRSKASTTSGGSGTGTTTTPTTTPPTTTPAAPPKPAPSVLTATQSYHVAVALTNPVGGLDTIDPVDRLSLLPSTQEPLLLELGVLQGGNRVLFVVQPGTVVNGPGVCIPGPIDCQLLSLAPNETEGFATQSPSGVISGALMDVTGITVDQHSSAAAADKAREKESAAGRRLLNASTASALSLFPYRASLGALVDLRNVTGGS